MDQLDFFGGSVPFGVPKVAPQVPPVVFSARASRRRIRDEAEVNCKHCAMNARRFLDGRSVTGWARESDIKILRASVLITQRDGSTLKLCEQHAQEHEERGKKR